MSEEKRGWGGGLDHSASAPVVFPPKKKRQRNWGKAWKGEMPIFLSSSFFCAAQKGASLSIARKSLWAALLLEEEKLSFHIAQSPPPQKNSFLPIIGKSLLRRRWTREEERTQSRLDRLLVYGHPHSNQKGKPLGRAYMILSQVGRSRTTVFSQVSLTAKMQLKNCLFQPETTQPRVCIRTY